MLAADYGDAPAPYPVTLAEGGAGHVASGVWQQLGIDIDGEAADDRSGFRVAASADGRTVAIGATHNDISGSNAGHVRVFRLIGNSWSQIGQSINGEAAGDLSSRSIAISANGNTVAVGAALNDGNGDDSGHVRIYGFNGTTWEQIGQDIDGEAAGDESGQSVDVSADGLTVAIGAPYNDGNGSNSGHVRVYKFDGSSWTQLGSDIDGANGGDFSGWSVGLAANGGTLAVGAVRSDGNGPNSGQVRVYHFDGTSWLRQGQDIYGEAAEDQSANHMEISADGTTVIIGARYNDGNGVDAGHARVFRYDGSVWYQLGGDIDGEAAGDWAGWWVSISDDGDTVAVASRYNSDSGVQAGHVRVFQNHDGYWKQLGNSINGESALDWFGSAVSLSGDGTRIAVGAMYNDGNGSASGHTQVYYLDGLRLGTQFDVEANGIHSDLADADSDDGVSFGELRVGQTDATVTVNVQNAPLGANLDAWIDFNGDGNWGGPDEQIFSSLSVVNGDNVLHFEIPANASKGNTYARFRLSSDEGIGITGVVSDGEVEDYVLEIQGKPPGVGEIVMGPQTVIDSTKDRPTEVAAGDIDGDGDIDLLVASAFTDGVIWYENIGEADFSAHSVTSSPNSMRAVEIADLDGDGDQDLLSASNDDNTIAWYQNDGAQNFTRFVISSTASGANDVRTGDFNSDGLVDVVSFSSNDDSIRLFLNLGTNSFDERLVDSNSIGAWQGHIVDVNGDGKLDILSASMGDDTVSAFLGDGSGEFTKQVIDSGISSVRSVIALDIDNDGDQDILSASATGNRLVLNENQGGTFVDGSTFVDGLNHPVRLYSTDLDGDTNADILVTLSNDDSVVWLEQEDSIIRQRIISDQTLGSRSVIGADIDQDGDIDVISASYSDDKIAWYENLWANYPPTLDTIVGLTIDEDAAEQTVNLAGISAGDGETQPLRVTAVSSNKGLILDPAVNYTSPDANGTLHFRPLADQSGVSTITVTVEDAGPDGKLGTGHFEAAVNYNTGHFGRDMVLTDLNADGQPDAVVTHDSGASVAVLLGQGEGLFGESTYFATGDRPYALTHGDFNQDGRIDIASANTNSGDVSILLGDGAGGLGVPTHFTVGSNLSGIATGDLNQDGHLDLVITNTIQDTDQSVSILTGLGDGTFNTPTTLGVSQNSRPEGVLITDRNKDGKLDIVTSNTGFPGGSDTLGVLLGNGDATFADVQQYSVSDDPFGVAVGDFNNDGNPDLVASTWGVQSQVSVILGSGDGTFGTATHFDAGSSNYRIAVADFDLDGKEDLIVGNAQSTTLSLLLGAGDGTFGPRTTLPVASEPNGLMVSDLNGDGVVDIATSTGNSKSLSVLLGISSPDNASFSRTFDVTVNPVNDVPTLDELADLTIDEDAAEQTVNLTGISAGGGESQPLRVTARSSDTNLIPDPKVDQGAITSGLVGYFPFDGTAVDESGNGRDGVVNGAVLTADRFGVADSAYRFDGVDDRIDWTDSIADSWFEGKSKLSVALWVKPLVVTSTKDVFFEYGISTFGLEGKTSAGQTVDFFTNNSSPVSTTLDVGEWNHVVLQIDGTNKEIYKNGVLTERVAFTDAIDGASLFALGGRPSGGLSAHSEFDDLRIYNRALSSAEVSYLFEGTDTQGDLAFTPVAHQSGTATITVTVEDGGLDLDLATTEDNATFSRTFDVTVNPVNDAPVLDSLPDVVIDEDGVVHGNGTNLKLFASDIDSDESKLEFRIVNLAEINPQFGLSIGMDPQSDSFAVRGDSSIHVHPAANFFGSTQVVIEVRDPEGDVSQQETFNLVINAVNDPPVLDPASDLSLSNLVEDSGSPVGQVGTLVSTLIDENGPLSNYSDVDGIAPGIAVLGKNIAIEKIWFSADDGQNWLQVGSVSNAEALVLEADATTRVYLQTEGDVSGDLADALTIKAWDQTGGYSNGQFGVDSTSNAFSSQTDVVSLSVEPSPSSAADDFYSPEFDGVETFVISKADLLANDTLGNGESIDTITITADATSTAGGTITVDGDEFTYTRPASWFSGIDTFGYTLDDGGSTSNATVTILSGLQGDTLTITLEPGRDHDVIFQYADEKLVLMDHVTQETLLNIPKELVPANVDVIGAPANSNIVSFSELSDSEPTESTTSWSYQGGSANDELAVLGTGSQWAWLASDPQVENDVTVDLKRLTTSIDSYTMIAVEKVSVEQVDRVEFSDPYLEVGTQTFELSSTKPVNLPTDVTISEGILRSITPVGPHVGESIVGSGQIDAVFAGGVGSLIRATGDLAVGSNSDSDGFRTDGRLEVGANTVTLLDSNQASLGELTTLGDGVSPGTLNSDYGLAIGFTGNLEGFGTIETLQGDSGGPLINNGNIAGNSSEQPITINAKVKGVGTFDHVVMNGEFTPGFSPALWKSGTVTYADANRFVIELGGRLAGSEFDRVEHYLAKLGGKLDVQLIDGFKPLLGDLFEVITSEQPFEGDFREVLLPLRDNGVRVRELLGQHGMELETVYDVSETLEVITSEAADYQIAGHDGSPLKVFGDRFRAYVSSVDQFVAENSWYTDQLEIQEGKLVQLATDGINTLLIEGSNWKNFVEPSDINNDRNVTALDALTVINELVRRRYSDDLTSGMSDPAILVTGEGDFYDQNGDGKCTALDALRVINQLVRNSNGGSGEGELVTPSYLSQGRSEIWTRDMGTQEEQFESEFEDSALLYSDAEIETPSQSELPEDLVHAAAEQESTEAVDSLLSDAEDWWR